MKACISVFLLSIVMIMTTQGQTPVDCSSTLDLSWVRTFGATGSDNAYDITTDLNKNIIITGSFSGNMIFGSQTIASRGVNDFFVAKFDSLGNPLWIKTGGSAGDDYGKSVVVDNNNDIYVAAAYHEHGNFDDFNEDASGAGDLLLIKYSTNGDYLWHRRFNCPQDDVPAGLAIHSNNIYLAATYSFAIFLPNGHTLQSLGGVDFFVLKFDVNGEILWETNKGGNGDDYITSIACDGYGNLLLAGNFTGTFSVSHNSVTATSGKDLFLIKYAINGTFQWIKQAGINDNALVESEIYADMSGCTFWAYRTGEPTNATKLIKFDYYGLMLTLAEYGGSGDVRPHVVYTDAVGNIYTAGAFSGNADFGGQTASAIGGDDFFVCNYTPDNRITMLSTAGSTNNDAANALTYDHNGSLLVCGLGSNGISFGAQSYNTSGESDAIIAKYEKYIDFAAPAISSIDCNPDNMCINVTVVGGTEPFNYEWDDGNTDEDRCNLSTGNHSVTVTDARNCFIFDDIYVSTPQLPVITLASSLTICPHDTVTISATSSYEHNDYSFLWNNDSTTNDINITQAGTYTVTVTDNVTDCKSIGSIVVTEFPDMDVIPLDTAFFCYGDTLTVAAGGFIEYQWSNGSTTAETQFYEAGVYQIRAYNGICHYYDTIRAIYYPIPSVNLPKEKSICDGDSVLIEAPDGFVSYIWSTGDTAQAVWVATGGMITLTATDDNGCRAHSGVNISVFPYPEINIGNDTTLCIDVPVILSPNDSTSSNTYLWNTGATTQTIGVTTTGDYWVQVTNPYQCTSVDTIGITIFPAAHVDIGDDRDICLGDTITLSVPTGFAGVEWSSDDNSRAIRVGQSGNYAVTVTDNNGCQAVDAVKITVFDIATPVLGNDTVLCLGSSMSINIDGNYHSYLWSTGSQSHSLHITQPGTYSLTVTDEAGCKASATITVDYSAPPKITHIDAKYGNIIVAAHGGSGIYTYSVDGNTWQDTSLFNDLALGFYTVWVRDSYLCTDTASTFLDESIKIPNFFTPNDDGFNDLWLIDGLHNYPHADIRIFDRYGKELYQSTGSEFAWDGIYQNKKLPSDSYWYMITLREGEQPITGYFSIIR